MTIQPRKCRSDAIMARSLAEKPESSFAPSHSFCGCTTFWRGGTVPPCDWHHKHVQRSGSYHSSHHRSPTSTAMSCTADGFHLSCISVPSGEEKEAKVLVTGNYPKTGLRKSHGTKMSGCQRNFQLSTFGFSLYNRDSKSGALTFA